MRFLRDLDRRGEWEWDFDESLAERYYSRMRLFKHTRGELVGRTKEPCDYELFVYGNVYGWIESGTGRRRFRKMYEQLARKNAKSQDKAIQALFEISAFGEPQAEAYVAATQKSQTRFVWEEAKLMYQGSCNEVIRNAFTCKYDNAALQTVIKHVKSGSIFTRLSKDDKNIGDGANPHFGILDEYHLHQDDKYYNLLSSGMKTRQNPLLSIITTAGFELNNPCYRDEYDLVSGILNPDDPREDDRYFAMICELDRNDTPDTVVTEDGRRVEPGGYYYELETEEAIMMSNPVTGWSKTVRENILEETKMARLKPEKMRDVLTKTFNVWVQMRQMGYMDMGRWNACEASPEEVLKAIADKAAGRCFIGLDLSAKLDLTSAGFVFPWTENRAMRYAVLSHSFMPEDKYLENNGSDDVPYDVWKLQEYLTVTDGAVVDYEAVMDYIIKQCDAHKWKPAEICIDPFMATSLTNSLQNKGFIVADVRQGIVTLSEPTKALREAVYMKRLMHDGNPVLKWAVGNAITRADHNDNIMLDKKKAKQRIDPIAAVITAFQRAMIAPPPKPYRPTIGFLKAP
jgi:phage terminase large subunit-like protein